jgi:hypothetical protein
MVALLPSVAKASKKTKTALNNTTINEPMRLMDVPLLNRCANLHVTLATICPHMALTEIMDAPAAQRAL